MSVGLLILLAALAVVAGAFAGQAAHKQLEASKEPPTLRKRAQKVATRGLLSWLSRQRESKDED